MATYKEIHGTNIEVLSSDPSNPVNGQIWYNTSTDLLKAFLINSGSWASAPNIATNRSYVGGCGTRSSALIFGGDPNVTTTQSWNNTAWSSEPALNTGRRNMGSAGTNNVGALSVGGYTQAAPGARNLTDVESYNGSWTSQTAIPTVTSEQGGAGTETAALSFGGQGPAGPGLTISQSYNGSWTTTPSLNTARSRIGGWGTFTSAIAVGGRAYDGAGTTLNATESYNGTWTTVANLPEPRYMAGMTQTGGDNNGSGYVAGGNYGEGTPSGSRATTYKWDTSSWTTVGNLPTILNGGGGGGSPSAGMAVVVIIAVELQTNQQV